MRFLGTLSKEVQRNIEFRESLFFAEMWTVMLSHLKANQNLWTDMRYSCNTNYFPDNSYKNNDAAKSY